MVSTKEPKMMAQYPKIKSIGSTGSIVLAILEVQEIHRVQIVFMNLASRDPKEPPNSICVVLAVTAK